MHIACTYRRRIISFLPEFKNKDSKYNFTLRQYGKVIVIDLQNKFDMRGVKFIQVPTKRASLIFFLL